MNILLVDDEAITVRGMVEGVDWARCGIDGNVYAAYSADGAKKQIKNNKIDLILCDIEMPVENGIELLRELYDIDKDIKVIFLTCHARFDYAQEALRLGCIDYILKPAPYEQIEEVVAKAVETIKLSRKKDEMVSYGENWLKEKVDNTEAKDLGDKRSTSQLVEDIVSFIIANLGNSELTIAGIAQHFFLNEDYMNRSFKKYKNATINQYIIGERMKLAGHLLAKEELSINAIADQVGYENYPYFSATFKKYHGCSPSQFRDKLKE